MEPDLFRLLLGAVALLLTFTAAVAQLRRSGRAPFYLVAAGLAGVVFFITVPEFPIAGGVTSLLLVFVGVLTSNPVEPVNRDWAESTATRRPR
jgi:hypothetical protein